MGEETSPVSSQTLGAMGVQCLSPQETQIAKNSSRHEHHAACCSEKKKNRETGQNSWSGWKLGEGKGRRENVSDNRR